MKKLLLLGALISSVAMAANSVELRAGADLSHSGKFKGGFSDGAELNKKSTKNGFELSAEYRTSLTDAWEFGGGIAYKHNKLNEEGSFEKKGIHQVPLYLTTRYNFKNSSEVTPYVKANLGYSFNSGSMKWRNILERGEAKIKGGLYTGIGTGIQYKNFVVDLSYNWNSMRVNRTVNTGFTRYEDKFNLNHGTLTLGLGYSFGF